MDANVSAILERIARRDIAAIGVLADYLEENDLPHAKRVRGWWRWYSRRMEWWYDPNRDHSRRHLTVWENVEIDKEYVRIKVGQVFRKKWTAEKRWRRYVST
jgi:hypothetical protein